MAISHLFIVRISRDTHRFAASARRIDEEACGEFSRPQQLLSFLLGQPHGHLRCGRADEAARRLVDSPVDAAPAQGRARRGR